MSVEPEPAPLPVPLPAPLPVAVRVATVDDARAISAVRVETWRSAYAQLMPEALLRRLDVEREAQRRSETWSERHADPRTVDLVAERDGVVVGWACVGGTDQDDLPGFGHLYAIYVLASSWSAGIGHALLTTAEEHLRGAGFERASLYVLEGNERAAAFYERHGWREDGHTIVDERFTDDDGTPVPLLERRRVRDLREGLAG